MSNKVILIDDNAWEHIAAKLKAMFAVSGFNLEVFSSAEAFFTAFPATTPRCPADLFIIDVMMPPGERYKSEETHDGLITGLFLAKDVRAQYPLVPVILWSGTNLKTIRLLAVHLQKRLTKCLFIKKPFPPHKLVELVEEYFRHGKFTTPLVQRIWDGIVVRPAIGGLGLDIKKLLDPRA